MAHPRLLVLIRHGESTWNKENKFTGWTDVPLSATGEAEAIEAAKVIKEKNIRFDVAFTSVLKRAVHTLWTILKETDQHYIPVMNTWRLNERHYGSLQGLNKSETAAKHGEEQVKIWRRAYAIPPPALTEDDERYPGKDPVYSNVPKDALPFTECLKDTVDRVLPFWFDHIAPCLMSNKTVLVAAHGNSLRGLVKHLDKMTDEAILELNIPTGVPLVYELDEDLKPIKHYYLMDEAELKKKMEAVANQGKANAGEEVEERETTSSSCKREENASVTAATEARENEPEKIRLKDRIKKKLSRHQSTDKPNN